MSDGVPIAATLFEPDGTPPAGGWPALMLFHGLGKDRFLDEAPTGTSANAIARTYYAGRGYAVLTFDARAHGASGGLFTLAGPREIQDVRELFAWLAARPEINKAKIGAQGVSYGGGELLRATAEGVPFAAIAPVATWSDLSRSLFPQNLTRTGIVLGFINSVPVARTDPAILAARGDLLANRSFPLLHAITAERSTLALASRIRVPVFWAQGRRDLFAELGQAIDFYKRLPGPKRLYLGDLGHDLAPNPEAEHERVLIEALGWFDHFLKGVPNAIAARPPIEVAPDPWTNKTYLYRSLPKTRTAVWKAKLRASMDATGMIARVFAPTRKLLEQWRSPVVKVTASSPTSWSHLVAVLTARPPRGSEFLVSEGGAATSFGSAARTVSIRMIDDATRIPKGSRLVLTLGAQSTVQSPANLLYLNTLDASSRLTVRGVTLSLPVLRKPISR